MTPDDKLRELCAKATPGPWVHWVDTHLVIRLHSRAAMAEDLRICEVSVNTRNDESQYNAAFIAAANPAAVLSLLDRIDAQSKRIAELEKERDKSERRAIMFGDILHRNILAMRAAVADMVLKDEKHGMCWIVNTLTGPGQLPSDADMEFGAQAMFDKELAEHEEFRRTHPAPVDAAIKGAGKGV